MNNDAKENIFKIKIEDFSSLGELSLFAKNIIKQSDLRYSYPDIQQRDDVLLKIIKYLLSDNVIHAGSHRKNQWEDGWAENLNDYLKFRDIESIVPKYFDKYGFQRLNGKLIIPQSDNFEIGLVKIFQYIIFENILLIQKMFMSLELEPAIIY